LRERSASTVPPWWLVQATPARPCLSLAAFYEQSPYWPVVEAGLRTKQPARSLPRRGPTAALISQLPASSISPPPAFPRPTLQGLRRGRQDPGDGEHGDSTPCLRMAKPAPQLELPGPSNVAGAAVILATLHRRETGGRAARIDRAGFLRAAGSSPDTALLLPPAPQSTCGEPPFFRGGPAGPHRRAFLTEPLGLRPAGGGDPRRHPVLTIPVGPAGGGPCPGPSRFAGARRTTERPEQSALGTPKLIALVS